MSMAIHRGRALGELLGWVERPLVSIWTPAGHPMRAEDYVRDGVRMTIIG